MIVKEDVDDDAHHLAQPGEVPAHHDLSCIRKERQDIRPALCVLQGNLENWSIFVATDLMTIVIVRADIWIDKN